MTSMAGDARHAEAGRTEHLKRWGCRIELSGLTVARRACSRSPMSSGRTRAGAPAGAGEAGYGLAFQPHHHAVSSGCGAVERFSRPIWTRRSELHCGRASSGWTPWCGARKVVVADHAAYRYSLMMLPRTRVRSSLRSSRLWMVGGCSVALGGSCCRDRCGRCPL